MPAGLLDFGISSDDEGESDDAEVCATRGEKDATEESASVAIARPESLKTNVETSACSSVGITICDADEDDAYSSDDQCPAWLKAKQHFDRLSEVSSRELQGAIRANSSSHRDMVLRCKRCLLSFQWTAGEAAFFASRGLSRPATCRSCRAIARKRRRTGCEGDEVNNLPPKKIRNGNRRDYCRVCGHTGHSDYECMLP